MLMRLDSDPNDSVSTATKPDEPPSAPHDYVERVRDFNALPGGLRARFEYGQGVHAPSGRVITDRSGAPALRQYAKAHLYRLVKASDGGYLRQPVCSAMAVCSPEDVYSKRRGRELALRRALEKSGAVQFEPAPLPF